MIYRDPEFGSQLITLLAAAMLVLQFLMIGQRMLPANVRLFAIQSFLLSAIALTIAYFLNAPHIYAMAGLVFVLKALAVPWFLRWVIRRIEIQREIEPLMNAPSALLVSGGLTLVGYLVARPFVAPEGATAMSKLGHNTLAVAITLVLVGLFLMIIRRKALSQVLALLTAENGLFLAAISLTYGMPLVVELGVFFDMFVLAIVCGILVFRIRESFDSMDVSRLSNLKG